MRLRPQPAPIVSDSPWLIMICVGLGAARLLEWAKPWVHLDSRSTKPAVGALLSTGGAVALMRRSRIERIVAVAAGANGVAMLAHQLFSSLQAQKDVHRLTAMRARTRR